MSEKLNITQVMELPSGTELSVYANDTIYKQNIVIASTSKAKFLRWKDGDMVLLCDILMNATFTLAKKPVSFEEVLNSNKRCRIEHERLEKDFYKDYDYAYLEFSTYLRVLLNKYNSDELKDILKNGKWYLEE